MKTNILNNAKYVDKLLKKVLERISILKDVQFCAYCMMQDQTASILNAYLSFAESSKVINKKIHFDLTK